MLILECAKYLEPFMKFLKLIMMIIYVSVPIVLIIVTMLDFSKSVASHDNDAVKKSLQTFARRAVAAVLIFLVPNFVILILRIAAPSASFLDKFISCYDSATIFTADDKKVLEPDTTNNPLTPSLTSSSCEYKIEDGKTKVSVKNRRVVEKYTYQYGSNSIDSTSNTLEIDGEHDSMVVVLRGKDEDEIIVCSKIETVVKKSLLPPVAPLSEGTIVFSKDTETLKVKIQKRSVKALGKNYYLTYIWVDDPYEQSSKAVSANYPDKLQETKPMLENEIQKENLKGKLVIATNASAYYNSSYSACKKEWDRRNKSEGKTVCGDGVASCFCYPARTSDDNYSKKYANTQVGNLLITKGKVTRNWPEQGAVDKSHDLDLYGIDPEGNFRVFRGINEGTEATRKELYREIINTGIKDTMVWYVPIILDGKTVGWKNNKNVNNITAFCQINRNNFVIFSSRDAVYNHLVPDDFEALGCQNAVNFDGGGSVEILYKDRNSSVTRLFNSWADRANAEVFYFTEK